MAQTQTQNLPEVNVDVKPSRIVSAYVVAPFDIAKETLESQGYRIISLEENARLRIEQGKGSYVSRNGNYTREGFVYIPKKGIFLTKNSPIMLNPVEATQAHRNGNEFYLNDEQIERALADSIQIPENQKPIPTERFADDEKTVFTFGNSAEAYGNFLREAGIKEMPIYLVNVGEKPFARQMWFWSLDSRSFLDGGRVLGCVDRVRGVRDAEGVEQKNLDSSSIKTYTPDQISRALKKANLSGIETILFEKLR